MNKLTDNEIIKVLECCTGDGGCNECPMRSMGDCFKTSLEKCTLDLINRQKAEIERLQKAIKVQDIMIEQQDYKLKSAKSEGIKEFAERLKEKIDYENELYESCAKNMLSKDYQQGYKEKNDSIMVYIDNLIKEMTEQRGEGK